MRHVIGLSGGKDSTALAFALKSREPRDYEYICTPTGDELPAMQAWWRTLERLLGKKITRITNKGRTLDDLIQIHGALPNHRQRWCTRQLKIEPTIAWCVRNRPVRLYVGLRADEDEREGIYSDLVESDFPFKRWGWGIDEVWGHLEKIGLKDSIPARTDCAKCYGQRISEWHNLWLNEPQRFIEAVRMEEKTGHTFRSPSRDTWPAKLSELAKEFERGRPIRGKSNQLKPCRVCSL